MVDNLAKEHRSWVMSRIRSRDTKPEIKLRSLLHRAGFRFLVHNKHLPGKPDITLPKYKTVVFVHGCFWHKHENCAYASIPKTRQAFWTNKFRANVERDKIVVKKLRELEWNVIIVWECELHDSAKVMQTVTAQIKRAVRQ
ncbi:MAG: very short patch repair endonuclease [Candidatus Porifericomitaceae bacterium WSBS_2022_MAG_OTU9]